MYMRLAEWPVGSLSRIVVPTEEVRLKLEGEVLEKLKKEGVPSGTYVIKVVLDIEYHIQGTLEQISKVTAPKFKQWVVTMGLPSEGVPLEGTDSKAEEMKPPQDI